jgi:hypothetical protein
MTRKAVSTLIVLALGAVVTVLAVKNAVAGNYRVACLYTALVFSALSSLQSDLDLWQKLRRQDLYLVNAPRVQTTSLGMVYHLLALFFLLLFLFSYLFD